MDIVIETALYKSNMHWKDTMEFVLDGEDYINFIGETADRKQWGGARQVTIFSRIENVRVDIHSVGNMVQTYDFGNGHEDNKRTISVLWCNIQTWGAQPNHYDLLHPTVNMDNTEKSFKQTYIETYDAQMLK
eukprot:14789504-Heterocapsa_arctica.AAC.1